jgi:acetyl-CoA carboxylase carboxyl transferase subunit alpha
MKTTFLDFEQPIAELEAKIEELRFVQDDSALDISEEIRRLQKKSQTLTKDIYAKLNASGFAGGAPSATALHARLRPGAVH